MLPAGSPPHPIEAVVSARSAARLRAFRRDVARAFPNQLRAVLLFGSRARGEGGRGSDYDVAVVLSAAGREPDVRKRISDIAYRYVRVGTPIRPVVLSSALFGGEGAPPLVSNIVRDGIPIA